MLVGVVEFRAVRRLNMKRRYWIVLAIIILLGALLLYKHRAETDWNKQVEFHNQTEQNIDNLEKSLDKVIEQSQQEKKELEQKNQDQQKQIDELNKQLQAKKAAEARLAVATRYSGGGNCESYRPIFAKYGWNVNIAMAIMQAESGCDPGAVSPTNDHGLMQINQGLAIYGQKIYDPAYNIQIAYTEKYLKGGWSHWTVYKTGAYLRYMS